MALSDKLLELANSDMYPFHMPGHKRNVCLMPDYKIDITEIPGFDNLHNPTGIIKTAMDRAARIYKSLDTFYVINGATSALHAAVYAACPKNGKILIARNCHKSVYNIVSLLGLEPIYVYGEGGSVTPSEVKKLLIENPDISAAVITSPTYDGIVSDISSIAKACHENNVVLIVDEAHGAHLPFLNSEVFPESALHLGADIVVHSVHKTLPAMTQTAILHRMSDRVSAGAISDALAVFESSSPSYVLMSSIENCIAYMEKNASELCNNYTALLEKFYERAGKDFQGICAGAKGPWYKRDIGKILIDGKNLSMTGGEIYDILINNYGIVPEMWAGDECLCLTSVCDSIDGMKRLADALSELYDKHNNHAKRSEDDKDELCEDAECETGCPDGEKAEIKVSFSKTIYPPHGGKVLFKPGDVGVHKKKSVSLTELKELVSDAVDSDGKNAPVCMKMVTVYPPGSPVFVPGELIREESVEYIIKALESGSEVHGLDCGCVLIGAVEE